MEFSHPWNLIFSAQVAPAAALPDVHPGHAGLRGDVDGVREGGQDGDPEEGGDDGRDLR